MINSKKKKFLSTLTVLAVAATATIGGLSLVSGSSKPFNVANADTEVINKTSEADATKYYVGGTNDSGSGTSESDPVSPDGFVSMIADLEPGNIVYVLPGIHKATSTWLLGRLGTSESSGEYVNGSPDDYIVFKALDPAQETGLSFYDQTFLSTNRGVHIYGNYYYWDGIDICGAGDNGMYIGGSYNVVENSEFYDNRDTGLQLGRNFSSNGGINSWPNYNLIRNCTSHNNYDNETKGENADGFAAKLTVGYHNIFDGCVAYRNSDDGWDLYGKDDTGIIGTVIMYNCVAFENGYLEETQGEFNAKFPNALQSALETNTSSYKTNNGDGNGFKLGGSTLEGDVIVNNCLAFNNRMHGVTDNSNPGVISLTNVTSYNNSALIDDTTGQISGCDTGHNNIDLARSESSYNNLTGVLSVFDGRSGSGSDAYIGSTENSLLVSGNKWSSITDPLDANTITGKTGEQIDAVAASDIFAELPANNLGVGDIDIDKEWRNSDGSLNLGDLFRIKYHFDIEIGCDLSRGSQSDYPMPDYTFFTSDEITNENDALAQAVQNAIYLPVKLNAVYQDFDVIGRLANTVAIKWTSSNEDVISFAESSSESISGVTHIHATVNRNIEKDENVTITASLRAGNKDIVKTFNVTVKQNEYIVGDILVEGVNISTNSIQIPRYVVFEEPAVSVCNAADYNGKLLPEDSFSLETTYMYAESKGEHMVEVAGITSSNAGIYEITHIATLGDTSNEYTYTLYVVDQNATVAFLGTPTVTVSYNSFVISGELNNVDGSIYAMTVPAPAEGEEVTAAPTAEELKVQGQKYDITSDTITANFTADNSEAYTIYYVVCNPRGKATSEVYSFSVGIQEISTKDELQEVISSGGQAGIIYQLTADIDLAGVEWNPGDSSGFVGYLDGNGYTISNLKISSSSNGKAAFIQRLNGGTIVNVNFNEFDIQSTANQVGIIGQAYSGNLINIKMTNINVHSSGQRVGGLIGQAYEANGTLPLIIDRVSLVNDDEHGITSNDRRAAGILGFVQVNTSPDSTLVDIRISNCYVDSIIGDRQAMNPTADTVYGGEQFSGIVGTYDASSSGAAYIDTFSMSISNCYFVGTVAGGNRVSGIIGYQQGLGTLRVSSCVSNGDIYYINSDAPITQPEKNASGIFGGYVANAPTSVIGCFAKLEEHNEAYLVTVLLPGDVSDESFWELSAGFDMENIWQFVDGVVTLR